MDWFKSEFGKQLSEFAQDVLSSEPAEENLKPPPADHAPVLGSPSNSPAMTQPHHEVSNRSKPATYANRDHTYAADPAAYANQGYAYNSSCPDYYNQGYAQHSAQYGNQGYSQDAAYYSNQEYSNQNYGQTPYGPSQPLSSTQIDRGVSDHSGDVPASGGTKETVKLYALINDLELKNIELEEQLKASLAHGAPAEDSAPLREKITSLEAQLQQRDKEYQDAITQQEAKLEQQNKRLQETAEKLAAEASKARTNEDAFKEAQAKFEEYKKLHEAAEAGGTKTIAERTPEDLYAMESLKSQCQGLLQEKCSVEAELAQALFSLKLSEEKSRGIQSRMDALPSSDDMKELSTRAASLEKELSNLRQKPKAESEAFETALTDKENAAATELQTLRKENRLLASEKAAMEKALKEKKEKLNSIEQQLHSASEEKTCQFDELATKLKESEDNLTKAKEDLKESEQTLTHLQKENTNLLKESEALKIELEAAKSGQQEKVRSTEQLHQELQQQSKALEEAQDNYSQKDKELGDVRDEVVKLEKLKQDSELRYSALKKKRDELQSEIEKLQKSSAQEKAESENNINRLNDELTELRATHSSLQEQLKDLNQKGSDQQTEILRLLEKAKQASDLANASSEKDKVNQETISKLKANIEDSQSKIIDSESKIQELESLLTRTKGSSESEHQDLLNQIRELKKENESSKRAATFLQEKLFSSQEELKEKSQELAAMVDDLAMLQTEKAQLTTTANSLSDELSTLKATYAALELETKQLHAEKIKLTDKLDALNAVSDLIRSSEARLKQRCEEQSTELHSTKDLLARAQTTIEELKTQNDHLAKEQGESTLNLKKELDSVKEKLSAILAEKLNLEQQLADGEVEKGQAQEALQALEISSAAEVKQLRSDLETTKDLATKTQAGLDVLKAKNTQLVNEQGQYAETFKKDLDSANNKVDALEKEKIKLDQQLTEQKTMLEEKLTQSQDALQALEASSAAEVSRLVSELEAANNSVSKVESSLEELSVLKAKLSEEQTLHTQASKGLESLTEKFAAIETEKAQLQQQITQLETHMALSEEKAAKAQDALQSLEEKAATEKAQLGSEIAALTQKISDQEALVSASKMNESSQIEQLRAAQDSLAILNKELAAKDAHSHSLQQVLDTNSAGMKDLQAKVSEYGTLQKQLEAALIEKGELQQKLEESNSAAHELAETKKQLNDMSQQLTLAAKSLEDMTTKAQQHDVVVGELQQEIEDYGASVEKLKTIIQSLSSEKRTLSNENDKMIQNIATMKTAVKAKLKEFEDENGKLKKHVTVLEDSHAELNRVYEEIKSKSKNADLEKAHLQSQIKALTASTQESKEEIEALHQKLDQATLGRETFLNEYSFRRQELESQVQKLKKLLAQEQQLAKQTELNRANTQMDLAKTLDELNSLRLDYSTAQGNLTKLQSVLEELQGAQSAEVEFAVEKLQREAEARTQHITELEYRAALAETKLLDYSQRAKQAELKAGEVQEQAAEAQRLKEEVMHLNNQLIELSKRLRKLGGGEDLISREFVAGLFTRFTSFPRGDPQKYEMLEIISAALRLSPEEQVEVGLVREAYLAHDYSLRSHTQVQITPSALSPKPSTLESTAPPAAPAEVTSAVTSPTLKSDSIGNI